MGIDICLVAEESDLARCKALRKTVSRAFAGGEWVDLSEMDEAGRSAAIGSASETMTGWEMLSFDEMKKECAGCPLSWDNGRGCIGVFGPDNTALPSIAGKYGCPIIASVPESAESGRIFSRDEAEEIIRECEVLESRLPEEGKLAVRRYSGPVARVRAAAEACVKGGCGMRFL
ncbi:MAG: hypothetical protein J5494_01510 [Candidatus Methanomethylophilaceae archaeon]|nr:hypothetical protein [Candidatus Methanomethylophilaceae archaeon]